MKNDGEDIKVNKRSTDKVYFESTFLQQISDGIDFLRNESREILKELDISGIDDNDIEEFGEDTLNQLSDIVDDLSQLKSEVINTDDIPDSIKESSLNAKRALNSDLDYVRRAKRRLAKSNPDDELTYVKLNIRTIELCNKAIEVNDGNSEAYYTKAQALLNLGNYENAIDEAIKSLKINDDYIDAWILIGDANRLNQDFDDAIDVYDKVLEKDSNSFNALKGKALTYFDLDDYQMADEFFKKASELEGLDEESQKIWDECSN